MAVLEKTERHTPPEVKRTRGKWLRLLTGDQLQMQTMIWPGLILCFILKVKKRFVGFQSLDHIL